MSSSALFQMISSARPSKKSPPSAFKPPPADDVGTLHQQFLEGSPRKPPSQSGQAKEFSKRQADPKQTIYCNRPQNASATTPITLLHPIFGQFMDDCENHKPTVQDNMLVSELSTTISNFYADEDGRAQHIREIFAKHGGIHLVRTKIEGTKYETDGDISHCDFRFVIIEIKNEFGYSGAEPFLQAIRYYLESTRRHAAMMQGSVLPCLIVINCGLYHAGCIVSYPK